MHVRNSLLAFALFVVASLNLKCASQNESRQHHFHQGTEQVPLETVFHTSSPGTWYVTFCTSEYCGGAEEMQDGSHGSVRFSGITRANVYYAQEECRELTPDSWIEIRRPPQDPIILRPAQQDDGCPRHYMFDVETSSGAYAGFTPIGIGVVQLNRSTGTITMGGHRYLCDNRSPDGGDVDNCRPVP